MGTVLTVAGVDFSANAIGYNAPNTRGLQGLFLEGGTLARSLRNLASGGVSATALNTASGGAAPVVSAGYISGVGGSGVQTGISDGATMSWIFAGRVATPGTTQASFTYFCGTTEGAQTGVGVYTADSKTASTYGFYTQSDGSLANKSCSVALAGVGTWNLLAFLQDGVNDTIQLLNLSTGVAGAVVQTGGPLVPGTKAIQFAEAPISNGGTFFAGQTDIALAEFHNVLLSSAECQAIYAAFKPALAARGVAV